MTSFNYDGTMILSSAACPSTTSACFTLGVSSSLSTLTCVGSQWVFDTAHTFSTADVAAVEWLTPTVIMAGLNNSTVAFHDLRSRATVSRLQHPHGVQNIRKVDDWRVVVAGWKGNVCLGFLLSCDSSRFFVISVNPYEPPSYTHFTLTTPKQTATYVRSPLPA